MKKYISVIIIVFLIAFSACTKLREKEFSNLTEQDFAWNQKNANSAIGAVYSNLRNFYGFNQYFQMILSADDITLPANASGWSDGGRYLRVDQHRWTSESGITSSLWFTCYHGALLANNIINQFKDGVIPPPVGFTKESIIAEMRVARAYYYWYLMDNYGNVPLIVGKVKTINPAQTSRADIYKFIVDEINAAMPNLSEDNGKKMYGRFNKWAAKTLLANVYLNAKVYTGHAEWDKVISECNDIINSGKYALAPDYSDNFKVHNENSGEIIFAVPFDQVNGHGFYMYLASLHASSKLTFNLQSAPWGAGGWKAVPQFINVYDKGDLRLPKTWLMGPQFEMDGVTPVLDAYDKQGQPLVYTRAVKDGIYTPENEGYRWGKFEYENNAEFYLNNDWPVFRYAQVLLMKAEALLRTGHQDQAAQIVTQVSQRDFVDASKAEVTGSELLGNTRIKYGYVENYKIVDPGDTSPIQYGRFLDELGAEFSTEGEYRRRDLIRFGVFTTKSWLSHRPNGHYRVIFPIPQTAMDANPKLVQNPGY